MTLEIFYKDMPLDTFIVDKVEYFTKLENYQVKIDGKICTPDIRDLILLGFIKKARLTDKTFSQVYGEYTHSKIHTDLKE